MPSQHSGTWSKSQSERLVAWMEENQEELRGKQIKWHKLVKEQVFSNDEHITVKRITDKATNMKRSWKEARAMQQRSGWGVKAENNLLIYGSWRATCLALHPIISSPSFSQYINNLPE
ncbi:hypothetical protein EV426DRAFT_716101 [Tirmania nivea]|nr:hypothetical protein EV426DRAFT_716101 [Tirmania nivea]